MNKGAIQLYQKLKRKSYTPKYICEIGVYLPEESNVLKFIYDNIKTCLIEADPNFVKNIHTFFNDKYPIEIIEAAVFDFNGIVELSKRQSSTFISQLESSPALVNDKYEINENDKFTAKSILFSEVDKGDFDLLSVDIEGAEWFVLKHMISKPNIISLETHGKYYTNPHFDLIQNWFSENGYLLWYKNQSDSVYIKNGVFPITFFDKIDLTIMTLKIKLIQLKKIFKA